MDDSVVPQLGGSDLKPAWYNPGGFIDPHDNPNVNPRVLKRYENKKLPVTIRTNNPAALSVMHPGSGKEFAEKQPGYLGFVPRPAKEGGGYARFETPEHGVHASSELLSRYGGKGLNTTNKIVRRWSTDKRAWGNYSKTLQKALGIKSGNTRIDLNNPDIRAKILMAKSGHESGAGVPVYNEETFARGVRGEFPGIQEAGGDKKIQEAGNSPSTPQQSERGTSPHFTPPQTSPTSNQRGLHEDNMREWNRIQNQPGGVQPGNPRDSRPGRESQYASNPQSDGGGIDKEVDQGKQRFDAEQKKSDPVAEATSQSPPPREQSNASQSEVAKNDNTDLKLALMQNYM